MDRQKTFPATLGRLSSMLSWLRQELEAIGCDETSLRKIELASEEALVNIIEHGYKKESGKIEIGIRAVPGSAVELSIRDRGPPFNPLHKNTGFDPLATLEERSVGGLGILFIRQYMDEVRYKRDKDANVLILIKKIGKKNY